MGRLPNRLVPQDTVLLIVDYQDRLLPAIHEPGPCVAAARRLIEAARVLEVPMLVTEQYPAGLGRTCAPLLEVLVGVTVIEKTLFSACVPGVLDPLKTWARPNIIVIGIEAHVCVQQTVLDLLRLGYTVHLCADAIGSRRPCDRDLAVERMRQAGAIITSTESTIFELLGQAGTDAFKKVLKIVSLTRGFSGAKGARSMDHREVGRIWDENAATWTRLARMGCDILRDHVNTPAFLEMLPDVAGLHGLDIGCGEGHNTRLVAGRGARMTAFDISRVFVQQAHSYEQEQPLYIAYLRASAIELPFANESFDFVMATMSFMDMPNQDRAVREAHRVLKRGGFLQFSISHPCFATPRWNWVLDQDGNRVAMECGNYFRELNGDIEEWIFSSTPAELKARLPGFRVPRFTKTLSGWMNLLIDAGFTLERLAEPQASDEALTRQPALADSRVIAYALMARCRKH